MKMCTQEVSLSWDGHHRTLISVFEKLLENGSLVDCTVVAEGQRLNAHKEVLSAFSPYFELIFKEENEEKPTVILGGITFPELKAFIDFMYHGKVKIPEDRVEDLIDAAESLQIKGLGGGCKSSSSEKIKGSSYVQARQTYSSDFSSKRKRKKGEKDSDLSADSSNVYQQDGISGTIASQTSNVNLEESSVQSATSCEQALPSVDGDCQILHPESVVKVELGPDDNTFLTENEYTVKPKREVVPCKRNRYSCESSNDETVLGLSADISMSSESNSYENLLPEHASADVSGSSTASSSPPIKILSPSKKLQASSLKRDQSSMDCRHTNTQNAVLRSELVVKSEPKGEEDINVPSDACFSEALKNEHPEQMALLERRRGHFRREVDPGDYEEDTNLYSGTAYTDDQWHHANSLQQQSDGTMKTPSRGPTGAAMTWIPGTTAAGSSGQTRGIRRGSGAPRPPRKYSCPECHKVFNQSCNLKVHMRTHTGEKPYKCTECDFAATHVSNLKQHLRTHSGERPYKCMECDYAATDISSFKRHQRMHNGERPYKCADCDYAATDVGSFRRHQRIHSGERPYKCTECEYAATGSGDLNKHKRIHSRERPDKEAEFDCAVTGTSNLISSIPKYFENFNIYR